MIRLFKENIADSDTMSDSDCTCGAKSFGCDLITEFKPFSESIQFLQQASETFKTNGYGLNQALTLNYLSLAYQQLGKFTDAETAITKSLTFLQKKDGSKDYLSVRAQALNIQGKLQLVQGKPEVALKTWEEATKVYNAYSVSQIRFFRK